LAECEGLHGLEVEIAAQTHTNVWVLAS
jgi:hypothetical protein